jgi:hypothetical protein
MPGRLPDKRIDLTRRRAGGLTGDRRARGPSTVRSVHQVETVVGLVDDSGR